MHEFLHGYGGGTSHTTVLVCFTDPANPDTTRAPYHHVANESVLQSPHCRRTAPSLIDVMGAQTIEVNSILERQHRWLTGGNVAFVHGAKLSAGRTITLEPIETAASPTETQMVLIPIPGTYKA